LSVLIVISTEDPTRCPAAHVLPTPKCDGQTDRDPFSVSLFCLHRSAYRTVGPQLEPVISTSLGVHC
jgi:hypothetical protein